MLKDRDIGERYRSLEQVYDGSYASYNLQDNPQRFQAHLVYIDALVSEIVRKTSARNVLDVGCGVSDFRPFFERRGIEYWGIEMSEDAISKTDTAQLREVGAAYAERLPFGVGVFDCILAHHVVEHLLEPSVFIAELGRVARNGAYVAVVTTVIPFAAGSMWRKIGLNRDAGHVSVFQRSKWISLFAQGGFEYVTDFQDLVATDPPMYRIGRLASKVPVMGSLCARNLNKVIRASYLFRKTGKDKGNTVQVKCAEFVCPNCYGGLETTPNALRCVSCHNEYDTSRGFPNFKHEAPKAMPGQE